MLDASCIKNAERGKFYAPGSCDLSENPSSPRFPHRCQSGKMMPILDDFLVAGDWGFDYFSRHRMGKIVEFFEQLKTSLDKTHSWPTLYLFKFIVPCERRSDLLPLLPLGQIEERESRNGKYVSISIHAVMSDADAVIDVYQRVAKIPGVLSL